MIKKLLLLITIGTVVSTTALQAQDIVVNRIFRLGSNTSTGKHSAVELLVIKDNLDIRNWIVKEFANGLTDDSNGGKYRFNNDDLWKDLRSGTIITLREGLENGDVTVEGGTEIYTQDLDKNDFTLDVSFKNTTYMTPLVNNASPAVTKNFIFTASSEAVLIRQDDGTGSGMGYENAVHAMAWGSNTGSLTILTTDLKNCKKTYAAAVGPNVGGFIFTKSVTQSIADFDGGSGKGGRQQNAPTNGQYNWGGGYGEEADPANNKNKAYINELRAIVVLPVNAIDFKTVSSNQKITTTFTTVTEKNNSHFNIYRSADGVKFDLISVLKGNGTSNDKSNYVYNDYNPVNGINYYQIEQVDLDGKKTVLYTGFANFGISNNKLTAHFNNSGQLSLTVNSTVADLATITLVGVNGNTIFTAKERLAQGLNSLNFNVSQSAKGLVILTVKTAAGVEVVKLLK